MANKLRPYDAANTRSARVTCMGMPEPCPTGYPMTLA